MCDFFLNYTEFKVFVRQNTKTQLTLKGTNSFVTFSKSTVLLFRAYNGHEAL